MATERDVAHAHPFWAEAVPRHRGRAQRPHHELLQAPARVRDARTPVPHGERHGDHRGLHRGSAGAGRHAGPGRPVRRSIHDLDGSFTYSVSTAEGFGIAKGSNKPGVVFEDDGNVALSEEHAIAAAIGERVGVDRRGRRQRDDRVDPDGRGGGRGMTTGGAVVTATVESTRPTLRSGRSTRGSAPRSTRARPRSASCTRRVATTSPSRWVATASRSRSTATSGTSSARSGWGRTSTRAAGWSAPM